jgi:hypothetical protein
LLGWRASKRGRRSFACDSSAEDLKPSRVGNRRVKRSDDTLRARGDEDVKTPPAARSSATPQHRVPVQPTV